MKPYWIKYIEPTGMGRNTKKEWFKDIMARLAFYRNIMAAGGRVVSFGRVQR